MDLRDIVVKLMHLNLLHRYTMHKTSSAFGIYRGQPPILEYLITNGNCTQKEISDFFKISPASIAVSIKRMQKAGLLEKTADEKDLRYNRICITEKGETIFQSFHKAFGEIDKKLFNGFSNEEIEIFSSYLDRLIKNINEENLSRNEIIGLIHEQEIHKEENNA